MGPSPYNNILLDASSQALTTSNISDDYVGGMVLRAPAAAVGDLAIGTVYKFLSMVQFLTASNITSAFDSDEDTSVWSNVNEFFKLYPNGELHLLLVASTAEGTDLATAVGTLQRAAQGRCRQIGVIFNYTASNTAPFVGAYDTEIEALTSALPAVLNTLIADYSMPIDCVLVETALSTTTTRPNAQTLVPSPQPNLAFVVGYMKRANYSARGASLVSTILGLSWKKPIHESVAWGDESMNFGLSDGVPSVFIDVQQVELNKVIDIHLKGYITPRIYPGSSGYWIAQSYTLAPESSIDRIEYAQVMAKAWRTTYKAIRPFVNKSFDVDAAGRLKQAERGTVKATVQTALVNSIGNNISDIVDVIIDPALDDSNTPYPSLLIERTLRVKVNLRPKGKAESIVGTLAFTV